MFTLETAGFAYSSLHLHPADNYFVEVQCNLRYANLDEKARVQGSLLCMGRSKRHAAHPFEWQTVLPYGVFVYRIAAG